MHGDTRPLVLHVMYRFDTGGLENGVVNLINHMPADAYRHAVLALTEVTDFSQRVQRKDVEFIALHKPPGHGIWQYPKLFKLFRRLRPHIVHSRNLAALEVQVPAWAAGVPVRIHDPKCVNKTFPDYFERFAGLVAPVIAIDGPSGAGKSTVAHLMAERLGYLQIDTGAMYRAITWAAMRRGLASWAKSRSFVRAAVASVLPPPPAQWSSTVMPSPMACRARSATVKAVTSPRVTSPAIVNTSHGPTKSSSSTPSNRTTATDFAIATPPGMDMVADGRVAWQSQSAAGWAWSQDFLRKSWSSITPLSSMPTTWPERYAK